MRRGSHRHVLAAGAAATFLVLVGGFFFPLADRAWAGAVLAIVVAGPFALLVFSLKTWPC